MTTVADIMTTNVVSIRSFATVAEAIKRMHQKNILVPSKFVCSRIEVSKRLGGQGQWPRESNEVLLGIRRSACR